MGNLAEKIDAFSWLPAPEPRLFSWFPGERAVLERKEPLRVSEWAERYRVVSVSAIPGPWRNKNAPYLAEIMDTWGLPHVRKVIVCAGSQLGKTETMYNCHAYAIDYDPGPSLFVMPDEKTANRTATDRILPMIQDSPRLRKYKSKNPDDTTKGRIKFKNGMFSYLAWSNSPAALASVPIKHLNMDEVDLYPPDAVNQAEARTRTFKFEKKIMEISTPTVEEGRIWSDLSNEAQEIRDFYVPCAACGAFQVFDFAQVKWPLEIEDPKTIQLEGLGRYECEHCGDLWDDLARDLSVRSGEWRPRIPVPGAAVVGFHLPAFYSKFVSISDLVAAYLHSKRDPAKLKYFYNDFLALPIPEAAEGELLQERELYARREDYAPPGATWEVPLAACLLTMAVDVQDNRLEAEIIAWGPGFESWSVDYRQFSGSPAAAKVWEELDDYRTRTWTHESGAKLRPVACGIDSGGHHTNEVYKYVKKRQSQRVFAFKGSQTAGSPLFSRPKKDKKDPRKVKPYMIGTEAAKDTLSGWLRVEDAGPRFCHFPRSYGFEYFRQLCAEKPAIKKDGRGRPVRVWVKRSGYNRNEALDLRVYNLATLEILNPNLEKLHRDLLKLQERAAEELEDPGPGAEPEETPETSPGEDPESTGAAAGESVPSKEETPPGARPKKRKIKKRAGPGFVNSWKKSF